MSPDNAPRKQRRNGEAMATYLQMVRDAGPAGVLAADIAKRYGLTRTQTVCDALTPLMRDGVVYRLRPSPGVASRLYMMEFKPAEGLAVAPRQRKSRAKGTGHASPVQDRYLADAKAAGAQGITVNGQAAKYGTKPATVAKAISVMVSRGHLVARLTGSGKQHAMKTYFAPEFAPDASAMEPTVRAKPVDRSRAVTLAKDAPMVIPPHVKVQECPCGMDQRYTVKTPQRGWINSAECRPWAAGVAR